MNRILPLFLLSTAISVLAANPNDRQSTQGSAEPNVYEPSLTGFRRKAVDPALYAKALPEEREAVRAAIAGGGGAAYNDHGRVRYIRSEDATDAEVRVFAQLADLDCLYIGPPFRKPFEGR